MRNEEVVTLIEQYGYLHGDHYSFNTREFLQWSAQSGEPVSGEEAERLLGEPDATAALLDQALGLDRKSVV